VKRLVILLVACSKDFEDYAKKSKPLEAKQQLIEISRTAGHIAIDTNAFPVGHAGPTPSLPCCAYAAKICQDPGVWTKDPLWSKLQIVVPGESHFQYEYRSDGNTFTATATGDLDCKNHVATYEISGRMNKGFPEITYP
jgi:hypothetical protein